MTADPESKSKIDEEGKNDEKMGGRARTTPRIEKRGTSVFQVAINIMQCKNTQRMLKCRP